MPKDFDIIELRFEERGGPLLVKGGALARQAEDERARANGRGELVMTQMVQVAIAGDVTEAEELQAILQRGRHRLGGRERRRPPSERDRRRPDESAGAGGGLEAAEDAIEAMSEPDELISDA